MAEVDCKNNGNIKLELAQEYKTVIRKKAI
jgi:hypothetical protein